MARALKDKGGNLVCIAELDSSNALSGTITDGTNGLNCGLIADSGVDIDANITKFKAEDGKSYGQDEELEGKIAGTVMETDKTKTDYLAFGVRGKDSFLAYKYEGIKNGKHQEIYAIVDVTPQMHFKTPGGTTANKLECVCVPPLTAVTFTAGALAIWFTAMNVTRRGTGSVVIPAGQELLIVETAVA